VKVFPIWRCLGFVLVDIFDMFVFVILPTELFPAELALESLEFSVYSVDVSLEVSCLSIVFLTLSALVRLEFFVNSLDVSLEIFCQSKVFPTLSTLVGLLFLVNCLDVLVKSLF